MSAESLWSSQSTSGSWIYGGWDLAAEDGLACASGSDLDVPSGAGNAWLLVRCVAAGEQATGSQSDLPTVPMCGIEVGVRAVATGIRDGGIDEGVSGAEDGDDDDEPVPGLAAGDECSANSECDSLKCRGGVCCSPDTADDCAACQGSEAGSAAGGDASSLPGSCAATAGAAIDTCPASCTDPSIELACGAAAPGSEAGTSSGLAMCTERI